MANIFGNKLKSLRGEKQIPQRRVASILDIDTATYCKIEKGDRRTRREQVYTIARFFEVDSKSLLQLWAADKVYKIVENEDNATQILNVVAERISNYGTTKEKV